jgi:hypothetical protein
MGSAFICLPRRRAPATTSMTRRSWRTSALTRPHRARLGADPTAPAQHFQDDFEINRLVGVANRPLIASAMVCVDMSAHFHSGSS